MQNNNIMDWYADQLRNKHQEALAFCVYDSDISNLQLTHDRGFMIGILSVLRELDIIDRNTWYEEFDSIYDIFDKKNLLKEKERISYLHGNKID